MAKLDQALITETARTIVDRGDELTLTAIARDLDVTQPALYYHVDSIEDVQRWLGIAVRAELVTWLSTATIGRSDAEAVRAAADAWRTFSQQHPGLYRSTEWHPVEGDRELEEAVGEVLDVLAGSLRGFDLTADERANAAIALRSTLHGFVSFELGAGNPSPTSPDDSFFQVIELLITAVQSMAAGAVTTLAG